MTMTTYVYIWHAPGEKAKGEPEQTIRCHGLQDLGNVFNWAGKQNYYASLKPVITHGELFLLTWSLSNTEETTADAMYEAINADLKKIVNGPYQIRVNNIPVTDLDIDEVCLWLYFGNTHSQSLMLSYDEIAHGKFENETLVSLYSGGLGKQISLQVLPL